MIEQAKRLTPEERAELIKALNENVPPAKRKGHATDRGPILDHPTSLDLWWALQGLNLRLIPCEGITLPLS
jgi:hypothetical protein